MANETKLANLINPQVMGDMISAKLEKKLSVKKYAKVDTTLQGQPGDTITIPKYGYIGDAVDVAEGADIPTRQLTVTSTQVKVKKVGVGVTITDEALLSGYGNPQGQATNQLALAIESKIDNDGVDALYTASTTYTGSGIISYKEIVNAVDKFGEETNSEKVMLVHPNQVTQLRLDPDFITRDKYGNQVMEDGEIGMVANTRIVPSKKVKHESGFYFNPIIKLTNDAETEDATYALSYFIKRDVNVENDRIVKNRTTETSADEIYACALTDDTKVIIAKMKETASV